MKLDIIDITVMVSCFFTLWALMFWFLYFIENKSKLKIEKLEEVPELKRHPLVTIAVPAYNEEKHIVKTLNSLSKLNYPDNKFEIIVVNDCSKDNTKKIAEEFIQNYKKNGSRNLNFKLINQKNNKGKAEALNTAVNMCNGEFFICIDADSTVHKDAIIYIMKKFEEDKSLSIVTPVMKIDNPTTLVQKFQRLEYMASILLMKLMSFMDCNFVAPGPFSTYRVSALKKLGPFDGKHNLEDQEIAWRAQKKHHKIRQCSNAYVYTVGPNTLKKLTRQRTRWYRGSILTMYDYRSMFFNKRYGDFGLFQTPLMLLYFLLAIVSMVTASYYFIKAISNLVKNLILTNFDILTPLKHLTFNFSFLDVDVTKIVIMYSILVLTLLMLYFASRFTNERVRYNGSIAAVLYFFIFYLILGAILIKSLVEIAFRRKQKW
ncbi:MAG: glycosyltransferase [Candidatus Woesearchaeota archaeon]|jgi:biofilm PGA synthesis N-glycosyltransferase PgaC